MVHKSYIKQNYFFILGGLCNSIKFYINLYYNTKAKVLLMRVCFFFFIEGAA